MAAEIKEDEYEFPILTEDEEEDPPPTRYLRFVTDRVTPWEIQMKRARKLDANYDEGLEAGYDQITIWEKNIPSVKPQKLDQTKNEQVCARLISWFGNYRKFVEGKRQLKYKEELLSNLDQFVKQITSFEFSKEVAEVSLHWALKKADHPLVRLATTFWGEEFLFNSYYPSIDPTANATYTKFIQIHKCLLMEIKDLPLLDISMEYPVYVALGDAVHESTLLCLRHMCKQAKGLTLPRIRFSHSAMMSTNCHLATTIRASNEIRKLSPPEYRTVTWECFFKYVECDKMDSFALVFPQNQLVPSAYPMEFYSRYTNERGWFLRNYPLQVSKVLCRKTRRHYCVKMYLPTDTLETDDCYEAFFFWYYELESCINDYEEDFITFIQNVRHFFDKSVYPRFKELSKGITIDKRNTELLSIIKPGIAENDLGLRRLWLTWALTLHNDDLHTGPVLAIPSKIEPVHEALLILRARIFHAAIDSLGKKDATEGFAYFQKEVESGYGEFKEPVPDATTLQESVPDATTLQESVPDATTSLKESVPDATTSLKESVPDATTSLKESVPDATTLQESVPNATTSLFAADFNVFLAEHQKDEHPEKSALRCQYYDVLKQLKRFWKLDCSEEEQTYEKSSIASEIYKPIFSQKIFNQLEDPYFL